MGCHFPSPGDLPDPEAPALKVDSLPSEPPGKYQYALKTIKHLWLEIYIAYIAILLMALHSFLDSAFSSLLIFFSHKYVLHCEGNTAVHSTEMFSCAVFLPVTSRNLSPEDNQRWRQLFSNASLL